MYIVRETRPQAPVITLLTSAIFFFFKLRMGGECGKQGEFCPNIATIPPKTVLGLKQEVMKFNQLDS